MLNKLSLEVDCAYIVSKLKSFAFILVDKFFCCVRWIFSLKTTYTCRRQACLTCDSNLSMLDVVACN